MNLTEWKPLFLQFKRPFRYTARKPKEYPYWFRIETAPSRVLFQLVREYAGPVFYVFPLVGDSEELTDAIPAITQETFFGPLEQVGLLDDPPNDHRAEAYPDRVVIHSRPHHATGTRGSQLITAIGVCAILS